MSERDAAQDDATPRRAPARVEAEKRRRAALLAARALSDVEAPRGGERYLVVRVGAARYGMPLAQVEEIHATPPVTPLPGAPPFIAGVVCLDGEPTTLLDIGRLLGAAPLAGEQAGGRMVVVGVAGERVGLRVDGVEEVERGLIAHALPRAGSTSWLTAEQVIGVTEGAVLLLDIQRVLGDARIRVEQAGGRGPGGTS